MIRPFKSRDLEDYENMSREFYDSEATDHKIPEIHFRRTFDETVPGSPLARGWMLYVFYTHLPLPTKRIL